MRDREAKARSRLVLRESRLDSARLEASERIAHKREERAAGSVEFDRVRTTVDEVNADPLKLNKNLGYYTNFVNLLDLCALAIPAGFLPNGLPGGVTLMAPAGRDDMLLALGERFEKM